MVSAGSGIEGLSQEQFAMRNNKKTIIIIFVLLLGGALQRNKTPSD